MKKLLFSLVFLFSFSFLYSQEKVYPFFFKDVIRTEGMNKGQIHSLLKRWFATDWIFSGKELVYDNDSTEMSARLSHYVDITDEDYEFAKGHVDFIVDIYIMDNKIVLLFHDFTHKPQNEILGSKLTVNLVYEEIPTDLKQLPFPVFLSYERYKYLNYLVKMESMNSISTYLYHLDNFLLYNEKYRKEILQN
jgi:hypothetical protein